MIDSNRKAKYKMPFFILFSLGLLFKSYFYYFKIAPQKYIIILHIDHFYESLINKLIENLKKAIIVLLHLNQLIWM
jgi:hypothetical protein